MVYVWIVWATTIIFPIITSISLVNQIKYNLQRNISCDYVPHKTIFLTYTNSANFDLLLLQRVAMVKRREMVCIGQNMIHICLDPRCPEMCRIHSIPNCAIVMNETSNTLMNITQSTFREPTWNFITYIKWEFIRTAVELGANYVLIIDADLLLLKNPFQAASNQIGKYDLLHQIESVHKICKESRINGGLLIIQSNSNSLRMIDEMIASKTEILIGGEGKLEQEILARIVKDFQISKCFLDFAFFSGHCQYAHVDSILMEKVVSYHAHCTKSISEKIALMYHFLNMIRIPNTKFNEGELHRNYFNEKLTIADPDKPILSN